MATQPTTQEASKTEQEPAKPAPTDEVQPLTYVAPTSNTADQPWWMRAHHNPNTINA